MTGSKELAAVVRQFRLEAGLTQRQLEEKFRDKMFELFGTTYKEYTGKEKYAPGTYVSKIETLTTRSPGWKRIVALADALGRDRDVFLVLAGIRTSSAELLKKYSEASDKKLFDNCRFALTPDDEEEDSSTNEADEDTVDLGENNLPTADLACEQVEKNSESDDSDKPWIFVCHSALLSPTLVHDLKLFAKRRGLSIPAAIGQLMEIALSMFVI